MHAVFWKAQWRRPLNQYCKQGQCKSELNKRGKVPPTLHKMIKPVCYSFLFQQLVPNTHSVFCGSCVYTETFFVFPRTWCNNTTGWDLCYISSVILSSLQSVFLNRTCHGGQNNVNVMTSSPENRLYDCRFCSSCIVFFSLGFVGEVGSNSSLISMA